jgi:small-conductance mechanosensitive channel
MRTRAPSRRSFSRIATSAICTIAAPLSALAGGMVLAFSVPAYGAAAPVAAPAAAAPRASGRVMTAPENWAEAVFWGNSVSMWLTALATLAVVFIVAIALQRVFVARLRRAAERTTTRIDDLAVDLLASIRPMLVLMGSLVIATRVLNLDPRVDKALQIVAVIACCAQLLISSSRVIDFSLQALVSRSAGKDGRPDETVASSMGVVRFLAMLGVLIVVVLLALDNLGVAVTPLLAGLGIGGIAIALAVQNILGDLFASVSILIDKPFVVGDAIQIGDKGGTVERIGVKTTRLRALSGEELVVANSDLLNSRIHNFRRMQERRIEYTFGLTYDTPLQTLRDVPGIVKEIIEGQESCRFDRCALTKLNVYSVDFNVVYFVNTPDYSLYLTHQQDIHLKMLERFRALSIEFALPTAVSITGPTLASAGSSPASPKRGS